MCKDMPIKVGIVGLGRAGWDIHVKALRDRTDYKIVGVMDIDEKRLNEAKEEFNCEIYRNYETFLRESDAELVVIATRSDVHAKMSIRAFKAGKHVLVEKPMGTNYKEVCGMVDEAKKNNKILTIHQNRRLDPDFLHIQEVIESNRLGEVFMIKISVYGFSRRNDWQVLKKYGGGLVNNWGAHMIDQAIRLLGSPVKDVFSDLKQVASLGDAEDSVKVILRGENGRVADIDLLAGNINEIPRWIVLGTTGSLVCDKGTSKIRYFDPKKLKQLEVDEETPERKYGSKDVIPWQEEEMPAVPKETLDFYGKLYDTIRKKEPLLITPESVCEQIRILELCKKGTRFE